MVWYVRRWRGDRIELATLPGRWSGGRRRDRGGRAEEDVLDVEMKQSIWTESSAGAGELNERVLARRGHIVPTKRVREHATIVRVRGCVRRR